MHTSQRPRQWRPSSTEDYEDETSESHLESSEPTSGSGSTQRKEASVGPPPSYDGDRRPGKWEDYKLRAKLWLKTTTIAETSRGPRMLQQLTGRAFDTMKFMAEDDSWFSDRDNGQKLLDEMNKPEYFGKEEVESLWNSLHKLLYAKMKQPDDDLISFRNRFEEANRKV